ncbi:hypothetical protein [Ferrimonas marina]|uniref:hypothetical protein n=1 Tax=Ferrimonas marina TaxID=299255 RepID=UPI001160F7FF|nr:hypothetical protein [Ferrimonas marina]
MVWFSRRRAGMAGVQVEQPRENHRWVPLVAGALLAAVVAYGGYGLLQQHQVLEVSVTNQQGETQVYQVKRKDLAERAFVTVEGVKITLSDLDRMVVRQPG